MATESEGALLVCDGCGATVYPEHLEQGKAKREGDKLLCRHCLAERGTAEAATSGLAAGGATADPAEEPIKLVEEGEVPPAETSTMRQYGGGGITFEQTHSDEKFRRPLLTGQPNATRCRTFHAKLTDAALGHLNEQINEWIDGRDDIEIKFATSNIGVVEGKHADPHLVVTVFY